VSGIRLHPAITKISGLIARNTGAARERKFGIKTIYPKGPALLALRFPAINSYRPAF
jgi:hypothetical protein